MMFLSRTRPRPVSVSFFLNPHGPLSLTSHCPPRSAFPFSLPSQSLSCLWLSQFSFLFWSVFLSSVRSFLSFPFFFCVFPLPSVLALGAIYRAKGAGLFTVANGEQGTRRLVGQWARLARRGSLGFGRARSGWSASGRGSLDFGKARGKKETQQKERKKTKPFLSSPAARPGEEERGTVSFKTTPF